MEKIQTFIEVKFASILNRINIKDIKIFILNLKYTNQIIK